MFVYCLQDRLDYMRKREKHAFLQISETAVMWFQLIEMITFYLNRYHSVDNIISMGHLPFSPAKANAENEDNENQEAHNTARNCIKELFVDRNFCWMHRNQS